jgi:hypothetical protein
VQRIATGSVDALVKALGIARRLEELNELPMRHRGSRVDKENDGALESVSVAPAATHLSTAPGPAGRAGHLSVR